MTMFFSPKEIKKICTNSPVKFKRKHRIKKPQPETEIIDFDNDIKILCVEFLQSEKTQDIISDILVYFLSYVNKHHNNIVDKIETFLDRHHHLGERLEKIVSINSDSSKLPDLFKKYVEFQNQYFKEYFYTHFDTEQDFKEIFLNIFKDCVFIMDTNIVDLKLKESWPRIFHIIFDVIITSSITPTDLFACLKEIDEISENLFFPFFHARLNTFEFNIAKSVILENIVYRKLIGYNMYRIFTKNSLIKGTNEKYQIQHKPSLHHIFDKLNLFLDETVNKTNYIFDTLEGHPKFTKRYLKDYMNHVINDTSLDFKEMFRKTKNLPNFLLISIQLLSTYKFTIACFKRIFCY